MRSPVALALGSCHREVILLVQVQGTNPRGAGGEAVAPTVRRPIRGLVEATARVALSTDRSG